MAERTVATKQPEGGQWTCPLLKMKGVCVDPKPYMQDLSAGNVI